MSILAAKHFHDEAAAFEELEAILWPEGPVCPHCGAMDRIYDLKGVRSKPSKKNPEGIERHGLKKCGHCKKQFTVRVGTIFEDSHAPLHKWFQAIHMMVSSKKGVSSHQLHRMLEVQYNTAWFMAHRIREAMRSGGLAPMGGNGGSGIVEVDETFIGRKSDKKKRQGHGHKHAVLSLVERGGEVRSFHVATSSAAEVTPIVNANVAKEAKIMTDDGRHYIRQFDDYASHETVQHTKDEYVRGEVHTNTVEGYFSVFKRGMKGVYQHCSEKHLHRYLAEFDFRYNARSALGVEDTARGLKAIKGAKGKRLTYRRPNAEFAT
ncbi:IS1595 family transposase [Hyphomicrobium sp. 802]|uniref:IS1595 family transposase n=1 Tax=Hyphomicrobium sp. 802 TaxID=1112272 RepID=UPI00045E6340|nr:IS1595 family transposase [Hyphomicrobium sp. 802]